MYWFRRSIRLEDNRALLEAVASAERTVPVFILDPAILTHPTTGVARTRFLFEALADVDASLRSRGSRLLVRHGKPVEELERLAAETGATALFFGREYEPYGRERDAAVTEAMSRRGVAVFPFSDHLLSEPEDIRSKSGSVYTVFTPYKRVWFEKPIEAPAAAPERITTPSDLRSEPLPTLPAEAGVEGVSDQKPRVRGSEAEARRWLEAFLDGCVSEYDTARDYPAHEGTSRLSAYLRMGVISPRRVFAEVQTRRKSLGLEKKAGADTWLSELAWRDFYYQILFHFPHVVGGAFRPVYDAVSWENDDNLFLAWCEGRTGYPMVDAAQRQMNAEAWMHNRARMVTASFLTKDLLCDWRLGEKYFMQKLVDGDTASNNGGWQWAAGTGTDAQPFFRIFNPVSQGEKFDPNGEYVKRWIPELKGVPAKYIHRPWELSVLEQEAVRCVLGRDYPKPIVDHKIQREKALALYRGVQKNEAESDH
ncbi:MAG: deoxyribodipyrimidine photo-lyase [Cytophagales bacterium]|nr:deoxyribodipyrimidine photo-lyase [Armatimonadota bacterium]